MKNLFLASVFVLSSLTSNATTHTPASTEYTCSFNNNLYYISKCTFVGDNVLGARYGHMQTIINTGLNHFHVNKPAEIIFNYLMTYQADIYKRLINNGNCLYCSEAHYLIEDSIENSKFMRFNVMLAVSYPIDAATLFNKEDPLFIESFTYVMPTEIYELEWKDLSDKEKFEKMQQLAQSDNITIY